MTKINDGGTAFPLNEDGSHSTGMSLRDWFAGKALAGDLAARGEFWASFAMEAPDSGLISRARFYYRFADAMLAARDGSASV